MQKGHQQVGLAPLEALLHDGRAAEAAATFSASLSAFYATAAPPAAAAGSAASRFARDSGCSRGLDR